MKPYIYHRLIVSKTDTASVGLIVALVAISTLAITEMLTSATANCIIGLLF